MNIRFASLPGLLGSGMARAVLLLLLPLPLQAGSPVSTSARTDLAAGAASQQRVVQITDAAVAARLELVATEQQLKELTTHNQYMNDMVADQERALSVLQSQLAEVEKTRHGLVPQLLEMQAELELWVANDMPLRKADRVARLQAIRATLARADVSGAEKFRMLLQAYQIEAEYGNRLDTWQQHILVDGQDRMVNVVALGRIALLAMTTDNNAAWRWSAQTKAWQRLDSHWHDAIHQGIALANEKQTPTMLMLPLSTARQEITQ